jgi:hypothetical protein
LLNPFRKSVWGRRQRKWGVEVKIEEPRLPNLLVKRNSDFFQDLDPQIRQEKKTHTQLIRKYSDEKEGVKNLGEREII